MKKLCLLIAMFAGFTAAKADNKVYFDKTEYFVVKGGSVSVPICFMTDQTGVTMIQANWALTAGSGASGVTVDTANDPVKADARYSGSVVCAWAGTKIGFSFGSANPLIGTDGPLMYVTFNAEDTADGSYTFELTNCQYGIYPTNYDCAPTTASVTITVSDRLILDENSTTPFSDIDGVDVTVNRTLTGGIWNTIILPFEAGDPVDVFGPGAIAAEYDGITIDGAAATTDNIEIAFATTDFMEAGTPYIVMPAADMTSFEVDGVDVEYADAPSIYKQSNGKSGSKYRSTFTGTYVANTEVPENSIFLSKGKFFTAGDGTTFMKAFRAYFTPIWNGSVVALNDNSSVKIFVDGVETAIDGINAELKNNKVYSIDGKYIGEDVDLNRMQKGIYIVNGKKVINK